MRRRENELKKDENEETIKKEKERRGRVKVYASHKQTYTS